MGAWRLERAAATAKVAKAEAEFRKKQRAVCCSDRAGGAGKDGNPLKRDRMPVGVDSIIDSMASSAPAAVKEVLCTQHDVHTLCAGIEAFRQKRSKAAGGRKAFIAKMNGAAY